ncbi:FAD-binding oxidoreductase [Parvibaculum sp.]|uniref:FAD-binding oxidoreductase n=1 Tax=Parvibaculum sp. TaxID=2024848 RepID=UPI002B6E1C45|nr:FAD-binding oxidoreductase [Parvibaculum sp.]HUD52188.1 FAD-binding oxidoreductase [Parvibaculum sp.]
MKRPTGSGVTLERNAGGFDDAVLGTCFNGRDPGDRPQVLVQANDASDVVAAIRRARRDNLKVSICSGGHSWMQNHLRDGCMLIDMSRLNRIEVDTERRLAYAGPGCWSVDLDKRLKKDGLFFPIAHAVDVCLGGYLLQGGFGWNSRVLGLACENVVGIDVVTADGELIHASESENADLFWAARGSGPGFFGVVVRYHLKVHPRPKVTGIAMQIFRMKHLEEVFAWADRVGPEVPRSVEFQLLLTRKATGIFAPGVEIIAPVLAQSWKQAREDVSFLTRGPLKSKASLRVPLIPVSTSLLSHMAAKRIFPPRMRWSVDNMWSDASMEQLLPGIRKIADTLPPMPSHVLMLSWHPPAKRQDMAFSVEGRNYLALYGEWKHESDDAKYANWATEHMREMSSLSVGIQLADENLGRRPARFMTDANMARLDAIRAKYDPDGRFHTWRGRLDRPS